MNGRCTGCWYLLRAAALYTQDGTVWDALWRYHSAGDVTALDAVAALPDQAREAARRYLIQAGWAQPLETD